MLRGPHDARAACCRVPAPRDECNVMSDNERDIDDPATTFGELLSCLRLAAGVSQNALGRVAGVHASYINRLERGERTTPTREVIFALARALSATAAERDRLLWRTGYLPQRLQRLGVNDLTVVAVLDLLADERLPLVAKDGVRSCIEAMSTFWDSAFAPDRLEPSCVPLGRDAEDDK